jgi:molybdopterin converting factor small subunit
MRRVRPEGAKYRALSFAADRCKKSAHCSWRAKDRLLQDGDLRPDVAIAIDGATALDGLAELVGEDSEVHFIPPISGG